MPEIIKAIKVHIELIEIKFIHLCLKSTKSLFNSNKLWK